MWKVYRFFNDAKEHIRKKDGVGVIEMILLLAILIAVIVLFKSKLTEIVNDVFGKISSGASDIIN